MVVRSGWVIRIAAVAVLAASFYAIAGNAASRPASVVTLCYEDQDVRPWRYRDGGGLNFQLLDSAARQAGIILRYEATSWRRCLARLRDNEVDGIFAASFRADRLTFGAYPGGASPDIGKRLHMDRFVLMRRKGESLNWDGRSLSHVEGAIGIQSGYSVGEQLRGLGVTVDEGAASAVDLVRKLASGRVAGAALLAGEASRILDHNADLRSQVELLPVPLIEKPYYLMFSHAFLQLQPQQAEELWRAVEQVRTSVAYQSLERRTLAALGQS